jgi:membrane protease YdiL (CAAX protease family)
VFFVLAYVFSWAAIALVSVSIVFPILGLFGPAAAGLIVAGVTEGKHAVGEIVGRLGIWRVGWRWYVIAIGFPAGVAIGAAVFNHTLGQPWPTPLGEVSPLTLVLAVLIVGEELGWRGYALPRLLQTRSALLASLVLGLLWAGWHLPSFIYVEAAASYGRSFLVFCVWVLPLTALITWVFLHTRGSVLLASIFHAATNLSVVIFNPGMDTERAWLLGGTLMALVVLALFGVYGPELSRRKTRPDQTTSVVQQAA